MGETDKTVLVIEDDKPFRRIVEKWLSDKDYNVLTAVDGLQGFEKVRSEGVDLVILDIILPGASGITFLKDLDNMPPDRKPLVLVVSALDEDTVRDRTGGDITYDDFLEKPCEMDAVAEKVKSLIDGRFEEEDEEENQEDEPDENEKTSEDSG